MSVPAARAEEARAVMLELFPTGFEEVDAVDGVELAAYTDAAGEERLWQAFGTAQSAEVADDWHDRWRRFHRGVRIGELWVGPPWEAPPPDTLAIAIDPGRAFGTGGHPTTRLCLELLAELPRGSVLDVGCGSGVLAIAAARLGFAPVCAIDSDRQAVEAAAANAALNGVEIDVSLRDALRSPLPQADAAVVNVTLEVDEAVVPRLDVALAVTSGYLAADEPRFPGFQRVERRARDGWAADLSARAAR